MGTHHRGTVEEVRALDAFIKLMRASESVMQRLQNRIKDEGLTGSQFGALEALLYLGPLCQKALSEKILKSTGNMTMVVDNLEKRGLVRRERSAEDRRYITVHLTDEGRRLIESVMPDRLAAIVDEMGALTAEELEELGRLCRKLGRREGA